MNTASKNVDHQFYVASSHHRYEALKRLIDFNPGIYGLIFTRTKADAQKIAEKLTREGYDIDALHGDLTQGQRDKVMGEFREKTLQLLIATDVAARGIDVQGSPMLSTLNCLTILKYTHIAAEEPVVQVRQEFV
jgi:ATP-dependent RNA helicase DeaD